MNSRAAFEKNANLVVSSTEPYRWPRLKKLSAECGSMKKHRLPCTNPNHTVQCTYTSYQGTHRSSWVTESPKIWS